jgi:hypothetical protein
LSVVSGNCPGPDFAPLAAAMDAYAGDTFFTHGDGNYMALVAACFDIPDGIYRRGKVVVFVEQGRLARVSTRAAFVDLGEQGK